jgi:hypothetical protein
MARRALPYGDGRAAPRIADAIAAWLDVECARPGQSVARFFR